MTRISVIAPIAALFAGFALHAQQAPTNLKAPETYRVEMDLSTGPVVIEVTRSLAPIGADRFYNLVRAKYFDGARFFRVLPNFMVQFGLAPDPKLSKAWDVTIPDDPVMTTNARGTLTFAAMSGPNTRSEQLFINTVDNRYLDGMRFAPFGKVVSGMENVDKISSAAGDHPDQGRIESEGNAYLQKEFPNLDYIKTARIIP